VTANITRSAILPCDVRPQKKKADSAELVAEIDVTVVAEREKRLLSHRYPKKVDEAMPGMLNNVSKRVADV